MGRRAVDYREIIARWKYWNAYRTSALRGVAWPSPLFYANYANGTINGIICANTFGPAAMMSPLFR